MPQQRLTDRVIAPYITGDTLIHIVNTGDTTQYAGGSSYKATIDQVATYISQNYTMFSGGSGNCITDLYVSNLYGCSPITIHDNLILESGVTITSTNGGGQIELDYALQPSNILISTDNGGGTEAFINLQPADLNLSSNGDVRIQSLTSNNFRSGNLFSNKSQVLMEPDFVKIGVVDPLAVFSNDYESVVVYNTRSSDQTTSNGNKWPVTISSKNSTILSGVRNSVILGGSDITASTNNTVYVDALNVKTIGGATSIFNLGLDSSGNVVTGVTSSFTGGTVPGETIFSNGLSATTISATTIGSSTDCVDDLYVYNIHSCSPLNINPLDEGNVYFGSNSGITIDLANERLGVGTNSPQYPLQVVGTNSEFYYDPTSTGGRFNIFSSTGIPRFDVAITFNSFVQPATGGSVGMRTWTDTIFPGYGGNGDMFLYAGANTRNLNIINAPTSIGTPIDNIRFYAGTTPDLSTAHMFVDGSGVNKGFVGIGTESPSEKLDVSGKTKTTNFQMTSGATSGYVLTSDASGNASWGSLYNKSTINISSATILGTLSAGSPVQLLPAPSLGKYYDWHAFVRYTYGTIAYNNGGVGTWYIEQGGADLSYGFNLNAITTSRTWKATEGSGAAELIGPSGFETSAINIRVSSATTTGDGTISVDIYYRELDL